MKVLAPGIVVNGVRISPDEISAEVQYHPAETLQNAKKEAMKALVVRELLLQRAAELGLCMRDEAVKKPDEIIDLLLKQEIQVPEPDRETCLRYYESNRKKFCTSPLYEASHILYLAPPEDEKARATALAKAQNALARLVVQPGLFQAIAKEESACLSAAQGGHLGQISRGQTMPAFEAALREMVEGELSKAPVASEVGYHLIRLHKKADGAQLPFTVVEEWVMDHLSTQSWEKAFRQYLQILAGRAKISGFRFDMVASSPLVQ